MDPPHRIDFHFYIKCAKPLVLALPSRQDRTLACAWIKRLDRDKSLTDALKNNYLKLLITHLQTRKLSGPFLQHPSEYPTFSELPQDQNLFEVKQELRKEPYSADFSGDLSTYVAFQEIDKFGIHCYYAVSNDPITCWYRFDRSLLATGKSGLSKTKKFDDEGVRGPNVEAQKETVEEMEKRNKNDSRKVQFVTPSIGKKKTKDDDDRQPPSWGSNLLQALDDDSD